MEGQPVNLQLSPVHVCTVAVFSRESGVDEGVISGWLNKGYLPVKKIGHHILVNLAAFNIESSPSGEYGPINLQFSPVLVCTLARFAELSGVEEGVALGWLKKGYLPTKKIGKYTLINLAVFNQELLSDESYGE